MNLSKCDMGQIEGYSDFRYVIVVHVRKSYLGKDEDQGSVIDKEGHSGKMVLTQKPSEHVNLNLQD